MTARDTSALASFQQFDAENVLVLPLDVSNLLQINAVLTQAELKFGQVDVLVNNAGYGYLAAIEEGARSLDRLAPHQLSHEPRP